MLSTLKCRRNVGERLRKVRIEKRTVDDKYSLKNLIFMPSKANYVIPTELNGHKVFVCLDCGDRFVCESSFNYHVNRRSVKITYSCRTCSKTMVYMNRCNLLSHIRSHVFKTATINLVDLKLEPLPLEDMIFGLHHLNKPLTLDEVLKNEELLKAQNQANSSKQVSSEIYLDVEGKSAMVYENFKNAASKRRRRYRCIECGLLLSLEESKAVARVKHYSTPCLSGNTYNCPICPFLALNSCALTSHLYMHSIIRIRITPCPECGFNVHKNHRCQGFKLIDSYTFIMCPIKDCSVVARESFYSHFLERHIKKVFKCTLCETACLTESSVHSHILSKHERLPANEVVKVSLFYQCPCCPKRLVLKEYINPHISNHQISAPQIFPCQKCEHLAYNIGEFLTHYDICVENVIENETKSKRLLSKVIKQCTNCEKNTVYECFAPYIKYLPSSCFENCSGKLTTMSSERIKITYGKMSPDKPDSEDEHIKCPLCRDDISTQWTFIKSHFDLYHKKHRCLDVKLELTRVDPEEEISKLSKRKRKASNFNENSSRKKKRSGNFLKSVKNEKKEVKTNETESEFRCGKCGDKCADMKSFREHILIHRDPSTAYQCMECGCCYVVKPSFSTHLFIAHGIKNANRYIESNNCFNPDAFRDRSELEPVKPNQCKICREQFGCEEDLSKHFRVHGMAFLMTKRQQR